MEDGPGDNNVLAESLRRHAEGMVRSEETWRRKRLLECQVAIRLVAIVQLEGWENRIDFFEAHIASGAETVHDLLHPRRSALQTRRQQNIAWPGMKIESLLQSFHGRYPTCAFKKSQHSW